MGGSISQREIGDVVKPAVGGGGGGGRVPLR